MLRLFTPTVFRESVSDYSLPIVAFESFDDVEKEIDLSSKTFKFLLPVSIGDFAESNVPACFSNDENELRRFYEQQVNENNRHAFIISDFQVEDLDDICYSGTINLKSNVDSYGIHKDTTISLTYMNPIKTYAEKHISPRDLPEEVIAKFDRYEDMEHAFPKITDKSTHSVRERQQILVQAFDAARKLHDASFAYDGLDYNNYVLYYVDKNGKINLYEIVGEESFIKKAKVPTDLINEELNRIKKQKTKVYNN